MRSKKPLILVLVAAVGALAAGLAQARDQADVQWSVTFGNTASVPVYAPPPAVIVRPAPVPVRYYREPTRWDRDGDGIPNHRDRFYNPRWDVDGDGIPNRRDRYYNGPRYNGGYDRDRDHDGIPNRHDPHPNYPDRGWERGWDR